MEPRIDPAGREARPPAATDAPAGLFARLAAYFLDTTLIGLAESFVGTMMSLALGPLAVANESGPGPQAVTSDPLRVAVLTTLLLVLDSTYFAGSWVRWGSTPAQRLLGMAVVPALAAGRPPAETAYRRWAVLALGPLCVGILGSSGALPLQLVATVDLAWAAVLLVPALLDPRHRGLHDRAAGTLVVRLRGGPDRQPGRHGPCPQVLHRWSRSVDTPRCGTRSWWITALTGRRPGRSVRPARRGHRSRGTRDRIKGDEARGGCDRIKAASTEPAAAIASRPCSFGWFLRAFPCPSRRAESRGSSAGDRPAAGTASGRT